MKQYEFDIMKQKTETQGTGHRFPGFLTQEEEEKKDIETRRETSVRTLEFSYKRIEAYSQIIGKTVENTYDREDDDDFTRSQLLYMEPNMSMIHSISFRKNGSHYKVFSQMVGTVDKIYYKT